MSHEVLEPSDGELVAVAGAAAAHARVLARASTGRIIAAVIDTNGDGRMIEYEMFHLDDDEQWREVYSSGAGQTGEGAVLDVAFRYGRHNLPAPTELTSTPAASIETPATDRVPPARPDWWITLTPAPDPS